MSRGLGDVYKRQVLGVFGTVLHVYLQISVRYTWSIGETRFSAISFKPQMELSEQWSPLRVKRTHPRVHRICREGSVFWGRCLWNIEKLSPWPRVPWSPKHVSLLTVSSRRVRVSHSGNAQACLPHQYIVRTASSLSRKTQSGATKWQKEVVLADFREPESAF